MNDDMTTTVTAEALRQLWHGRTSSEGIDMGPGRIFVTLADIDAALETAGFDLDADGDPQDDAWQVIAEYLNAVADETAAGPRAGESYAQLREWIGA